MTILNCNDNGRKLSKRVVNSERKGEIARCEQFIIFPQCFQETCAVGMWKQGLVWERVIYSPMKDFYVIIMTKLADSIK